MTPKFLREEAVRFRGMAETVERDASRQRLLMMATDYEAKAKAADAMAAPSLDVAGVDAPGLPTPGLDLAGVETPSLAAPGLGAQVKVRVGRKAAGSVAI